MILRILHVTCVYDTTEKLAFALLFRRSQNGSETCKVRARNQSFSSLTCYIVTYGKRDKYRKYWHGTPHEQSWIIHKYYAHAPHVFVCSAYSTHGYVRRSCDKREPYTYQIYLQLPFTPTAVCMRCVSVVQKLVLTIANFSIIVQFVFAISVVPCSVVQCTDV